MCGVVLSIIGIILISAYGGLDKNGRGRFDPDTQWIGYLSAILSSVFVAFYEVFYAQLVVPSRPSVTFSLYMTGCIGAVSLIGGIPVFPILHYTGIETFELPDANGWMYILLVSVLGMGFNGSFMLVLSFCGAVLAAVGILLTIPLTIATDAVLTGISIHLSTLLGSAAILAGFLVMYSEVFVGGFVVGTGSATETAQDEGVDDGMHSPLLPQQQPE
jgi:solute carrier family 35, member F5